MKGRIVHTDEEVQLALPAERAAQSAWPEGTAADALVAPGILVARAESAGPFFSGSLSAFDAAELLSLLNAGGRTGVLTVQHGAARRTLFLRGGEVTFARSTERAERLDEVLYSEGRLSREQHTQVDALVKPGVRLGQLLVKNGVLTSAELFQAVSGQIRAIALALFDMQEGVFLFAEGPVEERTAVRLEESTRDLVVAGIRRADEQAKLWAQVGGEGAALVRGGSPSRALGRREEDLLLAFQEGDTAGTLLARRPLGRFDGVTALAGLMAAGALEIKEASAPPLTAATLRRKAVEAARYLDALGEEKVSFGVAVGAMVEAESEAEAGSGSGSGPGSGSGLATGLGKAFDAYARAIRHISLRLRDPDPRGADGLSSFFAKPPPVYAPLWQGLTLSPEGDLDMEKLMANARAAHGEAGRSRALEALESYLAFALFEAKNVLSTEVTDRLVKEVGRIQMGRDP